MHSRVHALEYRIFGVNITNTAFHSFIIIQTRKLGIDTAIAELGLEVRDVRNCLDMVQEIVNFITASPKCLVYVAYM